MPLAESELKPFEVPMSEIFSDEEFNCRGKIAPYDVIDLVRSIDQNGLQQPIIVQPFDKHPPHKYRIVSGHRRHAAFRVLERPTIPAIIKDGLSDLDARKWNLEENLKRQNLNVLQEARAIAHFKNAGYTQEDLARELGVSRGWAQVRFMTLELPPEIQEEVAAGFLTQQQIKDISHMPREDQFVAVKRIKLAREKGEAPVKIRKKNRNPLIKKVRLRDEIFEMQEMIQSVIGNNFGTRMLAWAAGEISDLDALRDLRELAKEKGVPYEIPADILQAAKL